MEGFNFYDTEDGGFRVEISEDLFDNIIQKEDDKPHQILNENNEFYNIHGKVIKWLIKSNELKSDLKSEKLITSFKIGYENGYKEITKTYADRYEIGNEKIRSNLELVYRKYRMIRGFDTRVLNEVAIMFYGNACGITACIEYIATTYPYDFHDFFTTYKDVLLIDKTVTFQFWVEYTNILPKNVQPESYDKFFRRFYLNAKEERLIPRGKKAGDEFSQTRDWQLNMLMKLKELAKGKYVNFDDYTFNAFGVKYSKIGKQKKIDPN